MDTFKLAALVLGLACCLTAMTYERPPAERQAALQVRTIMDEALHRPDVVPAVATPGRTKPVAHLVF